MTGDLVYATDHEFGDPEIDEALADFCRDAAAVVLDAHFTPEELPRHRGWGHSDWRQCAEFALCAMPVVCGSSTTSLVEPTSNWSGFAPTHGAAFSATLKPRVRGADWPS